MQTRNLTEKKLEQIDVVILCGGKGSRLAAAVNDRPKPMAEINQQPFLDILIGHFTKFGLKRFVLCTGYMSEIIKEYYRRKSGRVEFVISEEAIPLGTAGCIKKAKQLLQSRSILVANGDSFCPINLHDFYDFHSSRHSLATIAVAESEETESGGLVKLDNLYGITGFEEKKPNSRNGYISTGIYLFQNEILSLIPEYTKYSLECDLFPRLVNQESSAFVTHEELIDIGTPERYERAKEYFISEARNSLIEKLNRNRTKLAGKAKQQATVWS
jgi:NDP-sugar pyrophosphorylase family protein